MLDVNTEDVLEGGLYRKCNTYKGGGGYDSFPKLAESRFGPGDYHFQFIVQLYGCNLDCPFCYVTRAGVWGHYKVISTSELVAAFNRAPCNVFHLMGGAPALAMRQWPQLLEELASTAGENWVFHSDLMLTEAQYNESILDDVSHDRALYAVGLKGLSEKTYRANTRKAFSSKLIWSNLDRIEKHKVPYYFTFTNVPTAERRSFWGDIENRYGRARMKQLRQDALVIPLIVYNAESKIDDIPWGGTHAGP
ncbi:MAG: radical SAM protein [bacterium]|nr:radical SAM protein [bacterium]